jgi:aspartate carbamoyltransferase catalytic subunit
LPNTPDLNTHNLSASKRHLLGIKDLNYSELRSLLQNSLGLLEVLERDIKKVPTLRGRGIINLFLEPSTRTRVSFELAAKRMSADAVNVGPSGSSTSKGEDLYDMVSTLEAMVPDVIVVRHSSSLAPYFLAKYIKSASIINAGDGCHEHPTQALLDCLSIEKKTNQKFEQGDIAIIGDIFHSRVARSNILAHQLLGNKIRLVGPPTLVPSEMLAAYPGAKVKVYHNLIEGIRGADVIMCLRMQKERQIGFRVADFDEYSRFYGLNLKKVEKYAPNALILHPGPVNRGIEMSSDIVDNYRSLITNQVTAGVAVRMACLLGLISGEF